MQDLGNLLGKNISWEDRCRVYEAMPCGIAVFAIHDNYNIIYSNSAYKELFGGQYMLINEGEREFFDGMLSEPELMQQFYFKSIDVFGKPISVRAFISKLDDEKAVAMIVDDSENTEVIERLDLQVARYASAISGTDETFFEYNRITDILTVFFSDDDGGIETRDIEDFMKYFRSSGFVSPDISDSMYEQIRDYIYKDTLVGEETFELKLINDSNDGYEWFRIILKPDRRDDIIVGSARNIEEAKKEEKKLMEKAQIDPLSKVYNRAAAIEKIDEKLAQRDEGKSCALVVLDIDNFKRINDTLGHLYGDAVIAMAAGSIKSTLDKEDVVGRFGGDEFFIFIDNAEKETLEKKLEDIRLSILKMRLDQNDDKDISCSIGVALGDGGSEYNELFRQADSALYNAKEKGKNRFEYFDGKYTAEGAISYSGRADDDESNEAQTITTVALEIASKSSTSENAISNIMRHIGMAMELYSIQVLRYDVIEDIVYLDYQWWRELHGAYNVVITEKKMGYYNHNDLVLFKNKFMSDKVFVYTPDFKEGFSQKYRDVLEKSEHLANVYASNNANENVFYSVVVQSRDRDRQWTERELTDILEITKIISMYLKSASVTSEREKMLIKRLDYDWSGFYSIAKFYDEAGRIGRDARANDERLCFVVYDIKELYKINITYGREVGDYIMDAVIEMINRDISQRLIACHVDGTDNFITMTRIKGDEESIQAHVRHIENELRIMSSDFTKYKNPKPIIKAGMALCNVGEYLVNTIDAAGFALKNNDDFDESRCIMADEVIDQYKIKNFHQLFDRRK